MFSLVVNLATISLDVTSPVSKREQATGC